MNKTKEADAKKEEKNQRERYEGNGNRLKQLFSEIKERRETEKEKLK